MRGGHDIDIRLCWAWGLRRWYLEEELFEIANTDTHTPIPSKAHGILNSNIKFHWLL